MSLIVVCGRPCVGKTTFTEQLRAHLLSALADSGQSTTVGAAREILIVKDEHLGINKSSGYLTAAAEKVSRAAHKAAIERALNKAAALDGAGSASQSRPIVIADGLNYIKGYRYELWCIAKAAGASYACVWVEPRASLDLAEGLNEQRRAGSGMTGAGEEAGAAQPASSSVAASSGFKVSGLGYELAVLRDLWTRFEPPDARNKWDSPLFRVAGVLPAEAEVMVLSGSAGQSTTAEQQASQLHGSAGASVSSLALPLALPAAVAQAWHEVVTGQTSVPGMTTAGQGQGQGQGLSEAGSSGADDFASAPQAGKPSSSFSRGPVAAPVFTSKWVGGGTVYTSDGLTRQSVTHTELRAARQAEQASLRAAAIAADQAAGQAAMTAVGNNVPGTGGDEQDGFGGGAAFGGRTMAGGRGPHAQGLTAADIDVANLDDLEGFGHIDIHDHDHDHNDGGHDHEHEHGADGGGYNSDGGRHTYQQAGGVVPQSGAPAPASSFRRPGATVNDAATGHGTGSGSGPGPGQPAVASSFSASRPAGGGSSFKRAGAKAPATAAPSAAGSTASTSVSRPAPLPGPAAAAPVPTAPAAPTSAEEGPKDLSPDTACTEVAAAVLGSSARVLRPNLSTAPLPVFDPTWRASISKRLLEASAAINAAVAAVTATTASGAVSSGGQDGQGLRLPVAGSSVPLVLSAGRALPNVALISQYCREYERLEGEGMQTAAMLSGTRSGGAGMAKAGASAVPGSASAGAAGLAGPGSAPTAAQPLDADDLKGRFVAFVNTQLAGR